MPFEVAFSPGAEADLDYYRAFEQRIIIDGIKQYLMADADAESKRRKKMVANPLAPWELRPGDFRIFYEIEDEARVKMIAIGHKKHNKLIHPRKRKSTMKTIDLTQEQPSINDLLRLAAGDPVLIRSQDGQEFLLESADAFDREVAEFSRSEQFMSFLLTGLQEPGQTSLEAVERRLAQAEAAMTDRP